jgi:hypothetical protein
MMNRTRLIAFALMVPEFACLAQTASKVSDKTVIWSPPKINWPDDMPRATVPKEMIVSLRVADMPIILEDTKLEDAHMRFGGKIGSRGDAGDAEGWLCLHGTDTDGPWIFWLTSGEVDGPAIDGFQWRRLSPNEVPDHRCRLIPQGKEGIKLPIAIRLGITEQEVKQLLGQPSYTRDKTLIFSHEHHKLINKEPYTVSNDVAVVLRDGMVWAMEVASSTSD